MVTLNLLDFTLTNLKLQIKCYFENYVTDIFNIKIV